jgi:hypothetical protein
MSESAVYDAFGTAFSAFAGGYSPVIPVSYPGESYDPPSDATTTWFEVRLFMGDTRDYGLSDEGPAVVEGVFRIGVAGKPPIGLYPLLARAKDIVDEFTKGTVFGTALVDRKPAIGGPIEFDDRTIVPVTISWRLTR